jgi:hypothetical protein
MEASYQLPTANRRTVIGEKGCGRDIGNSRCDRKEWGIPARSAARILAWVPVGFWSQFRYGAMKGREAQTRF